MDDHKKSRFPAALREALLDFDSVIPSLTEYTHDPRDLLDRREAVLELAEKLSAEL